MDELREAMDKAWDENSTPEMEENGFAEDTTEAVAQETEFQETAEETTEDESQQQEKPQTETVAAQDAKDEKPAPKGSNAPASWSPKRFAVAE